MNALPKDKPLQVPALTTAILAICALASIILGALPLLITSGSQHQPPLSKPSQPQLGGFFNFHPQLLKKA